MGENVTDSLALYRKLCLCRFAEDYIREHYAEDEMKTPMHMSYGQEHVAVGVLSAVGKRARVFCSYRTHAAYLTGTDDVEGFFAELYGRATGPNGGRAGSMHITNEEKGHILSSGIVAAQIAPAAGYAFAAKARGTKEIAVVFFGDGATNEGAFWESLNLASLWKLPALFVCEDNGLAVHTAKHARQSYNLRAAVSAFGITVHQIYTTDAELIRKEVGDLVSVMDARSGPGFVCVECYRALEHVGVNDDIDAGYRPRDTHEAWRRRDPIAVMRCRLEREGRGNLYLETLESEVRLRVELAAQAASHAPGPEPVQEVPTWR